MPRWSVFVAEPGATCPAAETCPMTHVTARPGQAYPSSRGQRILLIDDGIVFAAATRYASRTLAFLESTDDGSYREYAPSFDLPAEAFDILKKVDAASPPLRATDINLAQPFADKFTDLLPETAYAHGSDIQTFLAEALPQAQFVISESELLLFDGLCGLSDDDAAEWTKLDERFAAARRTISAIVAQYGVNFVHLSWGLEHHSVVDHFEAHCGRSPRREVVTRILEMYAGLFRTLTRLESPGADGRPQPVLLFQAGAPAASSEDYGLDCADVPGRIRVFSVPYAGSDVRQGGSHDYSLLTDPGRAGMACNDVYMVMGYANLLDMSRAKSFQSLILGIGPAPRHGWPPTSSFANPVALAHLVCLSLRYPGESAASWAYRLTDSWTKPILDPLLYDEFPAEAGRCNPGGEP